MGFAIERVQGEVNEDLLCPYCHEILEEPVTGKCGHVFCKSCLENALSKQKRYECPSCDVNLSSTPASEANAELVERLGKLSLHCQHYKSGCEGVFNYSEHAEHMEKDCPFRLVPCQHKNCKERAPQRELEAHMEKCDYRLVECKVCRICLPRKDMPAHQAIKRCFEELNKRRMVRSARRLSQELKEHRTVLVHQRHLTEQTERTLIREHYNNPTTLGGGGGRHARAQSAGPVLMRSSIQARVGSAIVVPHYSRNLKSAALESCRDCTNRFTHGRRPSARRHSHVNVS